MVPLIVPLVTVPKLPLPSVSPCSISPLVTVQVSASSSSVTDDDDEDDDDNDDVPGDGPGVRVVEDGQSCPELLVRVGVWNKTNVRHVGLHRTLITYDGLTVAF